MRVIMKCVIPFRFNVAFTYYGVVLMTAELFQSGSESGGKCEGIKNSLPHLKHVLE